MAINKQEIIARSLEIANKCAEKVNLSIVYVDYVFENGIKILRVVADKPEGLTIDDCSNLSELVSNELDVYDFIDEEYYLEVTSEGIEKELRNDNDITNSIGKYVYASFKEKIDKIDEVYGDLLEFDGNELLIKYNVKGRIKQIKVNKEKIEMIRLAVKF